MDPEALYREGDRLYWEGRYEDAEPPLLRAASAGHVEAAFRLGKFYDATGRTDRAIRWHRAAAERGNAGSMIDLALLIEHHDRRAAIAWTRRAAETGTDVAANYNLAVFLEEDGRLAEAEHHYNIAASVCFPAARERLGGLLYDAGRLAEAESWYRRALDERAGSRDEPGDADHTANTAIMRALADLLAETGRRQEALDLHRQAAQRL